MTDTPPSSESLGAEQTPGFHILAQFVRDFSFENPLAPESLRATGGQPAIDIGVELNARRRPDDLYEIDLKLTVKAERGTETAFVVELVYGGLFQVVGVPEEELEKVLLIECPRYLFPYARRVISDMTGEGGFPPFMLEPIDFGAVYAARQAQGSDTITIGNA